MNPNRRRDSFLAGLGLLSLLVYVLACTSFSPDDKPASLDGPDLLFLQIGLSSDGKAAALASTFFDLLCGRDPAHIWAPGGLPLPFCQRCAGLYLGALVATGVHLRLRPRRSNRLLEVHGFFLLLMVPFGFHWLPQEALLRTITGVLFGCGVATFLWAGASERRSAPAPAAAKPAQIYALAVAAAIVTLPTLGLWGGATARWLLTSLGVLGVLALTALSAAFLSRACWRASGRPRPGVPT